MPKTIKSLSQASHCCFQSEFSILFNRHHHSIFRDEDRWIQATCSRSRFIDKFERWTGKDLQVAEMHPREGIPAITSICYINSISDSTSSCLLTGDEVSKLNLLKNHRVVHSIDMGDGVFDLAPNRSSTVTLAAIGFNKFVALDLEKMQPFRCQVIDHGVKCCAIKDEHTAWISSTEGGDLICIDLRSNECSIVQSIKRPHYRFGNKDCIKTSSSRQSARQIGASFKSPTPSVLKKASCSRLLFGDDDHILFSCGLPENDVKVWDVRYMCKSGMATPLLSIPCPSTRSITSFGIHQGTDLYMSCMNNKIYRIHNFNLLNQKDYDQHQPLAISHPLLDIGSFYITLDIKENFLACGSSNGNAFIWNIENYNFSRQRDEEPIILQAESALQGVELSLVKWNSSGHELACATDGGALQFWGSQKQQNQPLDIYDEQVTEGWKITRHQGMAEKCMRIHDDSTIIKPPDKLISSIPNWPPLRNPVPIEIRDSYFVFQESVVHNNINSSLLTSIAEYDEFIKENLNPKVNFSNQPNFFSSPIKFPKKKRREEEIKSGDSDSAFSKQCFGNLKIATPNSKNSAAHAKSSRRLSGTGVKSIKDFFSDNKT